MGNRISADQDPVIMTANYLEEKAIQNIVHMQDLDIAELYKLIKIDGLEYDIVFSLDLEHQKLVNIDDLWRFQNLTKLEMPNNFLERIEGLESLVNLQSLDLSFNYIKFISNLENLVNLVYLNLTSNEIAWLENMDSLKQLRTFLVRYNKIKSFDNVCYLSELKNITNLAIDKNPIMEDTSMRYHILALLPQLKYLDFTVVTPDQLKEALKKFPPKAEKNTLIHNVHGKFKCSFPDIDKIPKKLCLIYQSDATEDVKDKNIEKLRKECDLSLQKTFKNFMNSTCLFVDLLSNICKTFKKEIILLNTKYIQEVEKYMRSIMNTNEVFADKLLEFYINLRDSGYDISKEVKTDNEELYEYDPAFLQLIKKKELIKMTLNLSLRFQSTMLNERINDLKFSLHNDLIKTIDEVIEESFIKQGEQTRNTVIFCNKQKCFIEKIFSKNNIFKHYLGYR